MSKVVSVFKSVAGVLHWDRVKHVLGTIALIELVVFGYYGVKLGRHSDQVMGRLDGTMQAIQADADQSQNYQTEVIKPLVDKSTELIGEGTLSIKRFQVIEDRAALLVGNMDMRLGAISASVQQNLDTLNTNQKNIGDNINGTIAEVRPKLNKTMDNLQAGSEVVLNLVKDKDPTIRKMIDDGSDFILQLDKTGKNAVLMTADGHSILQKVDISMGDANSMTHDAKVAVHNALNPDKPKTTLGKIKYYTFKVLGIIQGVGGTAFIVEKVLNGLN